jgi:hypothetical protein
MEMSEGEITLRSVRVKTDITISGSVVRISARLARLLHVARGHVLMLHWAGDEVYLYARDDPKGEYYGHLYRTHGGWRCSNAALARELLHGAERAAYRSGEAINHDGRVMVAIITRRNYAKNKC